MKLFFKNFFHIFSSWEKSGGYWICRPNQKPQLLKMHSLVVFLFLKKTKNVFHISIKTIVFHTNFYNYEQKTKFITSLSWDSFVPVGISIIIQTNEDSYWKYVQIPFFFSSVNKVRCLFFSEKSIPFCSCFLTKFWISQRKTFFFLSLSKLKIPKNKTFFETWLSYFYLLGGTPVRQLNQHATTKNLNFW